MHQILSMRKLFFLLSVIFFSFHFANAQLNQPFPDSLKIQMQQKVIDACKHAWKGYKEYAWGYDELLPLTKKGKKW